MKNSSVVKIHYAVVLPHDGQHCLWVQSPNGEWMLLSGHWMTAEAARTFALRCGYHMSSNANRALTQIEDQMGKRMLEGVFTHKPGH